MMRFGVQDSVVGQVRVETRWRPTALPDEVGEQERDSPYRSQRWSSRDVATLAAGWKESDTLSVKNDTE